MKLKTVTPNISSQTTKYINPGETCILQGDTNSLTHGHGCSCG